MIHGVSQSTLTYADYHHYESIKTKILQVYRMESGKIALLGTLSDFQLLMQFKEMDSVISDPRALLVSLYDAGKSMSLNRFLKEKNILPVTTENIKSNLLLNCMSNHQDRLYLFNFANNLGAKLAIDLCSDEDVAKLYWDRSFNTPASQGIGRTYIKGLP
jgi:hypothetical protein